MTQRGLPKCDYDVHEWELVAVATGRQFHLCHGCQTVMILRVAVGEERELDARALAAARLDVKEAEHVVHPNHVLGPRSARVAAG